MYWSVCVCVSVCACYSESEMKETPLISSPRGIFEEKINLSRLMLNLGFISVVSLLNLKHQSSRHGDEIKMHCIRGH